MAFTILNNTSAQLTLGEFNKNISKLGKNLKKISSGMKIISASDDSSAYSISEKMRAMIRSLEQDIENSQKGVTIVKIAEDGVEKILNSLREMKAMAINSANATNTERDRYALQKEFSQRMNIINDIASNTNYNGKILLDGRYSYRRIDNEIDNEIPSRAQSDSNISTSTQVIVDKTYSYNESGSLTENNIENLIPTGNTLLKEWYISRTWANGKLGYVPKSIGRETSYDPYQGVPQSIVRYGIILDFSRATKNGIPITFPDDLDGQGITMACQDRGTCPVYCSFIFDSSISVGDGKILSLQHADSQAIYVLGVKEVKNADEAEEAVFLGIKNLTDKLGWSQLTTSPPTQRSNLAQIVNGWNHDLKIIKNGDDYVLSMRQFEIWLYNGTKGITIMKNVETSGEESNIPIKSDPAYHEEESKEELFEGKYLIIHTGSRSNEHLRVYINDMHTKALGLDEISVNTRDEALEAIQNLDKAIEYTLNEAVRLGAYNERLEKTIDNIVAFQENVTGAENVIRNMDVLLRRQKILKMW